MKCSFCGSNVPEGNELCPSCGMIFSLGDEADTEITIPEYTPNVFGSEPIVAPAQTTEPVQVAPEYSPAPETFEAPAYEDTYAVTEVYEAPSYVEVTPTEPEVYEAPSYEAAATEREEYAAPSEVYNEIAENVSYPEYESFGEVGGDQEMVDDILISGDDSSYMPSVVVPVEEAVSDYADEYEEVREDSDDTYIKSGKKGGLATIAALCVLLVCLVVAGGYIYNRLVPQKDATPTKPSTSESVNVNAEATTDGDEEETTAEDTTEEDTTEEDTTEEAASEEETTVAEEETTTSAEVEEYNTTAVSTTAENSTTSKQTTTATSTTKSQTSTRKPTTTVQQTTTRRPTTTKPTTTDPYGINDVTLQKPSGYLSKTYHAYVTVSSVKMRAKPADSAERVQYLEKGSEVIVYAKQNGFSYVWSTRFGTYGWISDSYLSQSRPVESTTSVKKNTVLPDVNANGETKYTTDTLNLRKGPSKGHDVIKTVPINYPVKIIGYKSGVSGWAYVTDLTSGTNGWVSTAYLK